MEELKSCPFCVIKNNTHEIDCYFTLQARVERHKREYPYSNITRPTEDEINIAWNNRPHESKVKADAVRETIEHLPKYKNRTFIDIEEMKDHANNLERGEL